MTSSNVEFRVSPGQKEQVQWEIRQKCESMNTIDLFPMFSDSHLAFLIQHDLNVYSC